RGTRSSATSGRRSCPTGCTGRSSARRGRPTRSRPGSTSRATRTAGSGPGERGPAVAELVARGDVVGLFQGRMEFGPRALGHRSIIGDPRSAEMQSVLNLKIKYRESFRPFAPAALEERVSDYFDHKGPSPYMLIVADVLRERWVEAEDPPDDLREWVNQVR